MHLTHLRKSMLSCESMLLRGIAENLAILVEARIVVLAITVRHYHSTTFCTAPARTLLTLELEKVTRFSLHVNSSVRGVLAGPRLALCLALASFPFRRTI